MIEHRGGAGKSARSFRFGTFAQVWPAAQSRFFADAPRHPVALDGELHNWTELAPGATSPQEALGAALDREGPEFVRSVDGPFALAIARQDGIYLARDVVGKSPLYWGRSSGQVCFASEVKAMLPITSDIHIFPPGHYYHPEAGLVRFGSISRREAMHRPEAEVADGLRARLVDSVRKRMRGGPVGCWLSGGLDSATMAALARRQTDKLQTFAAGIEGAPDLRFARSVADYIGSEHHERVCTVAELLAALPHVIYHLESFDALLVRSSLMNFLVGGLASDHVPAVLSGEGGDELFAGYSYLKKLSDEEIPDELVDITQRLHNTALQRVDRCSAGHGMVARTAFLDGDVIDYALTIPAHMKLRRNGGLVEKWILRRAMDGLLPRDVLQRPKAKFWEGAGLEDLLSAHAEEAISDDAFAAERNVADGVTLNTKEELLYYRVFRDQFGGSLDPAIVGRTKNAPASA